MNQDLVEIIGGIAFLAFVSIVIISIFIDVVKGFKDYLKRKNQYGRNL